MEMESAVDQRQTVASLLAKAHRYRDLARWLGDGETVQRISAFSQELKQQARYVYRKSKSERIDDEVRPVWRANL